MKSNSIHWVGWLLFSSLILAFVFQESGVTATRQIALSYGFWLFIGFYVAVFYANTTWLLPRFFLRKKYFTYAIASFIFLGLVYFVSPFDKFMFRKMREITASEGRGTGSPPPRQLPPSMGPRDAAPFPIRREQPVRQKIDIVSIVLWGMIWATGMFVVSSEQWQKVKQDMLKSEADKVKAELALLKAQINPHFLFNTLNNLYTLATIKSDDTAPGILKLSNLLRYLVEESTAELVPLEREIEFIRNYIRLQQMRLNQNTTVYFSVSETLQKGSIAPMILITFIENAFKYGVSTGSESTITVKLADEEGILSFFCSNRIVGNGRIKESTGIGLQNTKQRLEYLYPNKHQLAVSTNDGFFQVMLKIDLSARPFTAA